MPVSVVYFFHDQTKKRERNMSRRCTCENSLCVQQSVMQKFLYFQIAWLWIYCLKVCLSVCMSVCRLLTFLIPFDQYLVHWYYFICLFQAWVKHFHMISLPTILRPWPCDPIWPWRGLSHKNLAFMSWHFMVKDCWQEMRNSR